MRTARLVFVATAAWLAAAPLSASGPLGIYGIVDKVVLEPENAKPERIQVWGTFVFADVSAGGGMTSEARRGYLYFALRGDGSSAEEIAVIVREWFDLQAVAGTGQAVGFGRWGYSGWFGGVSPDRAPRGPATGLRVRPAAEPPADPAGYVTNVGVVKLTDGGSHAAIIKQLRDARGR